MSDKDLQRFRHYEKLVKSSARARDTEIFRKRPLKRDKIPGPEVVKMDG